MPKQTPSFRRHMNPTQFAEAGIPGPQKRSHVKPWMATVRIGRHLQKELDTSCPAVYHMAMRLLLSQVNAQYLASGRPVIEESMFVQERDMLPAGQPYPPDMRDKVAGAAALIREQITARRKASS